METKKYFVIKFYNWLVSMRTVNSIHGTHMWFFDCTISIRWLLLAGVRFATKSRCTHCRLFLSLNRIDQIKRRDVYCFFFLFLFPSKWAENGLRPHFPHIKRLIVWSSGSTYLIREREREGGGVRNNDRLCNHEQKPKSCLQNTLSNINGKAVCVASLCFFCRRQPNHHTNP